MGKKENIIVDYLSQPEVFSSLFNGFVFGGKQIVKPEILREIDGRFRFLLTDGTTKGRKGTYEVIKRERDIVREVILDGSRIHLAVLGIEQQSEIDYSMALRTLVYDTLEYLKQARVIEQEHKRKRDVKGREFLSHFKKEDILVPTITIVFYTGKEKWDAAKDLRGLFGDISYVEEMLPFMVSSPLNLISVYEVEDTLKYQGSLKDIFELLKYVDDGTAMLEFIQKNKNTYSKLDEAAGRLLSLLIDMDFPENEEGEREGEVDMCKALEEIKKMSEDKGKAEGKAEGKVEGKAEGIRQGEAIILLSMLNKGMTYEEVSALTDVPLEQVKQITEMK